MAVELTSPGSKEVRFKQALRPLTDNVVLSQTTTFPPGGPTDGDIYIVPADDGLVPHQLAFRFSGAWEMVAPEEGWVAYILDEQIHVRFDGVGWGLIPASEIALHSSALIYTTSDNVEGAISDLDAAIDAISGGGIPIGYLDTDVTLAANSDVKIASQKAVKTYIDQITAANDAMIFKGSTDCSANPNYPAADRGWTYRVSVAGKIGGASGISVEAGDLYICLDDGTSAGTQAAQGTHWSVAQANLDGAVIGPASVTDGNPAVFDGTTGKLLKERTFTQFTASLIAMIGDSGSGGTKGLVPAPGVGDAAAGKFLKADGTFAIPAGTGVGSTASTTEVLTGTDSSKAVTPDSLAAIWEKGADVASSGTTSLGEGGYFHITGTTTITDIDWVTAKDGRPAIVIFDAILTLTHHATTLKLPGGANITTAAGDRAIFVQDNSDNVICILYERADGSPVIKAAAADIQAGTSGKVVTADGLVASATPQTLADAATIAWNMAIGYNAKVTPTDNRTFGAPTNSIVGLSYVLEVIQDGTGGRLITWDASFDWGSIGAPTLSTAAAKRDIVTLYCYDAASPKFRAMFSKSA